MAKKFSTGSHKSPNSEQKMQERLQDLFGDYVKKILTMSQDTSNEFIEQIKAYCKKELSNVTKNQLRNIFDLLYAKRVTVETLPVIRPKLAYISAKVSDKSHVRKQVLLLAYLLDEVIRKVSNQKELQSLKTFFEALIGYHRYYQELHYN